MAARMDPLGWSLRHTLHHSPFEGVPGLHRLHHVQYMFDRHASGQGRQRAINQRAFQAFCEDMGMVNPEMTRRLFLATDDDNTGAVEAHEFVRTMRLLCDDSSGDGTAGWQKARMRFAFNMFAEDREKIISAAQIRTVLKLFYSEARHILVELMNQIEDIYGMDIGVVSNRGTTYKVRWSEEPSFQRVFAVLEKKLADERWRMVDYSLDFREQGQVDGLTFEGFCKWCTTNNYGSRLRMLDWMKVLGDLWLQRMGLAKHANDPQQHHHRDACSHDHPGRIHPQHHDHPPARSKFQVTKIPMLSQEFHRLTQAQLTRAFGRANAFGIRSTNLDNFVNDSNQSGQFGGTVGSGFSGSGNLGRYENSLELSETEFDRCLVRLGILNPPLRKRFFDVFERKLQKDHYARSTSIVGAFGFIEPREFMSGLQLLMLRDRDEKFDMIFKMFDVQGRGFLGEAELHRLINLFFLIAHDAVGSIIHTFEKLLGKDAAIEKEIRAGGARLQRHYADVVTEAIFKDLAVDGPDRVKRLDLSELKQWSAENDGRLRDWFDCLGYHWLASIEKNVPDIETHINLVPEGVLRNLMGAYDMDPRRPLSDDPHYRMLQSSMWDPKSESEFKAEATKQPSSFSSGAPKIPGPNCTFQPSKVKAIQELFGKLGGADGVMSPLEWKRCLSAAGVHNEWVSSRLFAMFDTSGDQEMNAKEFTWGLSDICSEAPHPGTKMTPVEVRQAFAYRFYDTDLSGYFEKDECKQFLLSWKQACDDSVGRALDSFFDIFGLGKAYRREMEADKHVVEQQTRIAAMEEDIERELIRFNDDLFVLFTGTYGIRMNYDNFKEFARKAPVAVDWLTDLGAYLDNKFPTLAGLTFDNVDVKIDPRATELSQARMRKAFRSCSIKGVMHADDFVRLLKNQRVSTNVMFGKLLFRVIDDDCNGSVTEDEFVDAMTRTIMGNPVERLNTLYRIIDTKKSGFISAAALRTFLQSWFDIGLDQVNSIATSIDGWLNGRVATANQTSSSRPLRVGGLDAQLFVPTDRQQRPRDANLEIAVNMRKKSTSQVSLLVDYMVNEAMEFRQSSNPSKGKHLYSDEFAQWLSAKTKFIDWFARVGSPWMVTQEQAQMENDESKVGPAARRPVRKSGSVAIPTKAPVDPMTALITAADIGKPVSSIVYTAKTGEPYFGNQTWPNVDKGPGSTWWARALRNRAHVCPSQKRPKTHFELITLADVLSAFGADVAARRIYDRAKFRAKLRHEKLNFKSTRVMDKLYGMFDVNGDGLLDVEEAGCGFVLLARGSTPDRLRLAFDLFDVSKTDAIQKHDMRTLLRAFTRVATEVMSGMVDRLSELFGPEPTSKVELKTAEEYRMKLLKRSAEKLEAATERMIEIAFAADVNQDHTLSWLEFKLWAGENPTFSTWIEQLGLGCLESIAMTEDKDIRHEGGERPVPSTFRARRQFPSGTVFEKLRVYQVREMFNSYATFGQLNPEAFAACLRKLKIFSPYTVRRLFALFDRDGGGEVSMREFASGFFLLCGGSLEEKLAEAFVLADTDGNGFLDGQEMRSLFESFYTIAMDVVCCALSTSTAVLLPDQSFDDVVLQLSHERTAAYIDLQQQELEQFCSRDKGKFFFPEFYQWAEQDNDFLQWLESLRNLWHESIAQYEEAYKAVDADAGFQPHYPPTQIVRKPALFPAVPKGEAIGPEGTYSYPFTIKQTYAVTIKRGEANTQYAKRLQYKNPYGEPLRLSLTTDKPELLTLPRTVYVLKPLAETQMSLEFEMHPQQLCRSRGHNMDAHSAQIRLWVHNESAARNEECLVFNCSYLSSYETKLYEADALRRRN